MKRLVAVTDELENQFEAVFSDLKSAQCGLVKSIEQHNKAKAGHEATLSSIQRLNTEKSSEDGSKQHDSEMEFDLTDCPPLDHEQMETIVASVKDDYEQDF